MYIASPIGFDTLIYYHTISDIINEVSIQIDLHEHLGRWEFIIKNCIDRRDELYGGLDCDPGYNTFELRLQLIR